MFQNIRISTKLLLTLLPLALLAISISAYLNNRYQEEEMLNQAQASARTYADVIRESLVDMMTTREQVDDAYLERLNSLRDIRDLHIFFTTDSLRLREIFRSEERFTRLRQREKLSPPLMDEEREVFRTREPVWQRKGDMFTAVIPFKAEAKCQKCHAVREGYVLGAAVMDIPLDRISRAIATNWLRSFWVILAFTSIALILSIALYRALVANRLKQLIEAIRKIGGGNLAQPVQLVHSRDEIGELATAFDQMRARLNEAQEYVIHAERLSTIGQMASSIIHDFRTPMSTINLAVQSLQRGKEVSSEKTEQWYQMIRDAIQRMVTMAQELLDFSRGDTHLNKVEFSVGEFINLLDRDVRYPLEHSKVELDIQNNCGGTAIFDPDRLHRALINIINNAQDAMPKGGTVRLNVDRENGMIVFSIADAGMGIPPEIKNKIFDAFVTAGKKKGTGLGLAITKRIIDQHGGTIEVQSERGKGTTFTIRIPA